MSALATAQISAIKAVVEEEIDCDFVVTRSFDIFFDEEHSGEMKAWVKEQHSQSVEWMKCVQWLDGPNLERITGIKGVKGATSTPAASSWSYKFITCLLARCVELGAMMRTNTPITTTSSSEASTILNTAQGNCRASKVVYATNGYTTALLHSYRPATTPVKGSACRIVPKGGVTVEPPHLNGTYNLHYNSSQVDYLIPRPDGSITLGGGAQTFRHDRAQWFDIVDDSSCIESTETHFASVMPKYFRGWDRCDVHVEMMWSGIMGSTFDKMPHVGKLPGSSNEWMLAGFNGGGTAMLSTTAEAVAKMVTEGSDSEDTGLPTVFQTSQERMERGNNTRDA